MPGVSIASTVLRPERLLEPFLRYHLAIGFDHVFLFLDDPNEHPAGIPKTDQVTIIRSSEAYRSSQLDKARELVDAGHGRFLGEYPHVIKDGLVDQLGHTGLIVRQQLNLASALTLARNRGYEWLLSIDVDEVFHLSSESVQEHFQKLEQANVSLARYFNHEAVPESVDAKDPFEEVRLFLLNPREVPTARQQWADLAPFGERDYFRAYANGKPAVRVTESFIPSGSHGFRDLGDRWHTQKTREFLDPCILHYAECGFDRFRDKYTTLGTFSDDYFPGVPTISWLRRCRDVWKNSTAAAARSFYEEHVVATPDRAAALIAAGLCRRFDDPAATLAANRASFHETN